MTADPATQEPSLPREGPKHTDNGVRRLADALTWLRLVLAGPIVAVLFLGMAGWALALYLLAAATDFLDGRLARASGEPSALGVTLDPLADKVLVLTVLGALWAQGVLEPIGVVAFLVILAREFVVTALRIARGAVRRPFSASLTAKLKTFVQMSAAGMLIGAEACPSATEIARPFGTILLIAAALLALRSGLDYFLRSEVR
jgi:cardiolipin synthase